MLTAWALAATLAWQAHAASPSQRPRSLAEVIAQAMSEGRENPVPSALAEALKLGSSDVPKRKLRFDQSSSPDRKEHTFGVLYRMQNGKPEPTGIMITVGQSKESKGTTQIESKIYLADIRGSLSSAFRKHGPIEDVKIDALSVAPKVKKQFQGELNFFLKVAPALGLRSEL